MRLTKSVCTNLVFPESRKNIGEFRRMAEFLKGKGVACIEFYHDGPDRRKIGQVLADVGMEGVYIAVIPSKEQKLWLCDLDSEARKKAVAMLKACLDEAQDNGMTQVLINSGRITDDIPAGLAALAASVEELYTYAAGKNFPLRLFLEPCDTHMDAYHLIGPYARAIEFITMVRERGFPIELTMDAAHTAEEGEDFAQALHAARPYCNHIHFANCLIDDPRNPLYGDKHLGFEYANTVWSPEALAGLFAELEKLYPGDEPLRVALEVLCRTDDPYAYFETMWSSLPFLSRHA